MLLEEQFHEKAMLNLVILSIEVLYQATNKDLFQEEMIMEQFRVEEDQMD